MAALNIGGATIHSFLGLPPADFFPPRCVCRLSREKAAVIRMTKRVVIDEISMVRSDLFSTLAYILGALPLPGGKNRPFGGRSVVVCGDFAQLPPVVCDDQVQLLEEAYGGVLAFENLPWHTALFQEVCLRTPHRQANEIPFLATLDAIRMGKGDLDAVDRAIDALNRMVAIQSEPPRDGVILCTTNLDVARINEERDAELGTRAFRSEGKAWGDFDEEDYPTRMMLDFRIGSRVMLLANKPSGSGFEYVNGDIGQVVGYEPGWRRVEVSLDNGKDVVVTPYTWYNHEYAIGVDPQTSERCLESREVGSFEQLPLKQAYGISVHKSQGMSLDRVHILPGRGFFAFGQLYVALTRVRTLAGLSFSRPLSSEDVLTCMEVADFYEYLATEERDEPWWRC